MKEKINFRFLFIGLLSILLTAVSFTLVFSSAFQEQTKEDLQNSTGIIAKNDDFLTDPNRLAIYGSDQMRITLISPDGQIQYESRADESRMDNHLSRPEIQSALQNGSGEAMRQSSTLGYDTYYYALRLQNGSILRVSMEIRNMYSIFEKALPMVIVIGFLILLISIVLSSLLTKQLIKPIEAMAQHMDTMEENTPYKELIPFVRTIKEQQKKKMETAKMRQEFTANVSHELKTPLTSISGFAEIMRDGLVKQEDIPRFSGKIYTESQRLIRLVEDIIKLSQLDEKELMYECESVDLSQLIDEVIFTLTPEAGRRNISIAAEAAPVKVNGIRQILMEMIYNLCDNAVKYNREGGRVLISLGQDGRKVRLSVKDTGIGIPEEEQTRIFERFYRVDKSHSKEVGGTGLGLAIVKHAAALHEGKIELHSRFGEGTEIIVTLPGETAE